MKNIFIPTDDMKLSEVLELQYQNSITNREIPILGSVDIAFQQFLEQAGLSNREKDLLYISNFFNTAYLLLHVDVKIHKKQLTSNEASYIKEVYQKLKKLGLDHLLIKDFGLKKFNKLFN